MARSRICPYCQRASVGGCPNCKPKQQEQTAERRQQFDRRRGSASSRGYGSRWRKARESWLKQPENRYCVYCQQKIPPRQTIANIIDHFIPHRGDQKLFWDKKNWRPACESCHNAKTARGQ